MSSITVHVSTAAVAPRSHLRLTRRGRVVLAAVAAGPLVALALWFGLDSGVAAADNHTGSSVSLQHVTVAPGQSLWQIAEQLAPRDDPRDVVDALVDLNDLHGSVVTPGQVLTVPPQYAK